EAEEHDGRVLVKVAVAVLEALEIDVEPGELLFRFFEFARAPSGLILGVNQPRDVGEVAAEMGQGGLVRAAEMNLDAHVAYIRIGGPVGGSVGGTAGGTAGGALR